MERIIAPTGSKIDLSDLVESIQNAASNNLKDLMDRLFKNYGVVYSGIGDTSMLVSKYSSDTIEVAPGIAIVPAGHPIEISGNDDVGDRRLVLDPGYSGSLWIAYSPLTSDPVQVLDGFAWLPSGTQYEDSIQYSYYELVVADPGESGIQLATVHQSGTEVFITDLRSDNRLQIHDQIAHYQNTDTGTTATDFKVGVGDVDFDNGLGLSVKLVPTTPLDPLRPRILDISPVSIFDQIDATAQNYIPYTLQKGHWWHKAKVTFEWGFDYITGTGGSAQFRMEGFRSELHNDFKDFSADELVGYYLNVDGIDYVISSNDVTDGSHYTQLYLTLPSGAPAGTIPSAGSGNPAKVHHNADGYKVKTQAIAKTGGGAIAYSTEQRELGLGNTISEQTVELMLMLGWKYNFIVRAFNDGANSTAVTMAAGNYIDLGINDTAYASPFIVKIPAIDMAGADVTAVASDAGFTITIVAMTEATDFEIVYTTDNAGADFTNPNHHRLITSDRSVDIAVLGIREYNIKVRPLRGGWVCSTVGVPYVETSIVGGAGGTAPNEKILPYIDVDIYGEAVTGVASTIVDSEIGLLDYAYSGMQFPQRLAGKNVLDSYSPTRNKYKISNMYVTDGRAIITPVSSDWDMADLTTSGITYFGNVAPSVSGIAALTAMSDAYKRQRIIYQHNFSQDVIITKIDFDCDTTNGTDFEPAILRFYQHGNESLGKEVEIQTSDYFFADEVIDLSILSSRGNRRLIIDSWDPAGIGNFKNVSGILTIHYRDVIYTRDPTYTS